MCFTKVNESEWVGNADFATVHNDAITRSGLQEKKK